MPPGPQRPRSLPAPTFNQRNRWQNDRPLAASRTWLTSLLAMATSALQKLRPADFATRFLAAGVHIDGRPLHVPRKMAVRGGVVDATVTGTAASASARVGGTTAVAAATLGVRELVATRRWPADAALDVNDLVTVDVVLSAVASPRFGGGGGGGATSGASASARTTAAVAASAGDRYVEDAGALASRLREVAVR